MRITVLLPCAALALALATSCGADDMQETGAVERPSTPPGSSATGVPAPTATVTTGGEAQVRRNAGAYDLVLREVSVLDRGSRDRVVLGFDGTGRPGWTARFVDQAVLEGSGRVVQVRGDTVLRLDISGTPTRPSGRGAPVRTELGGDVVDVRAWGAYEGYTQVFVGLRGDGSAARVVALTDPPRVVVDIG